MKKTILTLCLLLIFSSIYPQNNSKNELVNQYRDYLSNLRNDFNNLDIAITKFNELFNNATQSEKDYGFKYFYEKYLAIIENFNNKIYETGKSEFNLDALYELGQDYKGEYNNSMEQKGVSKKDFEFYKKLVQFSLKLDMDEQGYTFVTLANNQFIKKNFNSFLSDEIFNYYSQLINEEANPAGRDAGLSISEKELVDRIIKWENIYKSVKMDFAKEKAKDKVSFYFDILFYGMDNTPAFNYVNNKLETGFKNAYSYLVNNYPSSVTSNIFKDYLNILKKNNFKKTTTIENFINNQTAKKITLILGSDIPKNNESNKEEKVYYKRDLKDIKIVYDDYSPQKDESNKEEEVYFVAVEEQPEPIGGIQGIQSRIVYPEIAKRAGVQGRVFVKAFIDENGDVAKVELMKGIGAGCDEAAMDAVKKTKFKPGKQGGKPVKVQLAIPLVFK